MGRANHRVRVRLITLFLLTITLGIVASTANNLAPVTPKPVVSAPPSGSYFDHIVFIMMENEGIQNICGGNPPPCNGSNTPFMSSLATNYTVASRYDSVYRPITSQPNYVAIIGGSTFTCPSNCVNINAPTLIDRLQVAGLTWKAYFESMQQSSGCDTSGSQEPYDSTHNPFIAFKEFVNSGVSNATLCKNIVVANPSGCGSVVDCPIINDLNNASAPAPSLLWLGPNNCDNMHAWSGCSNGCTSGGSTNCFRDGDNWLKSVVPNILNSRTFTTSRSALFITYDEGQDYCPYNGSSSEDCIYSSFSGPVAKNGFVSVSSHLYDHYNFTRTIEANWNLATLTTHDAGSGPMTEFFKAQAPDFTITPSPATVSFPSGGSANSTITLQSTNNFAGTITLTKSSTPTGLTLTLNPTSVTLSAGGSKTSLLTISSSTTGSYTATVTGTSGSLIHNATINVSVTGPPDFSITANPSSLTLGQASSTVSNPVTISPTGDRTTFESSYLTNSFYAKGLYWIFYEDSSNSCEHQGGCLTFSTSTNGTVWATPTTVPVHVTDSDFSVTTNGSNVYYVRYNETTYQNTCGKKVLFREGTLNTGGTVTWQSENTVLTASSTRLYADDNLILDSNGQAWIAFLFDSHGACGGASVDLPQIVHSAGTNYASWTGFLNLTTVHSSNWHIALASLGNGEIYASYWIVNIDLHGRLYNGASWGSDEQISPTTTLSDGNAWLFNQGTNVYAVYFDNRTETYNFASRSSTGTWTINTIGPGETHTGTRGFSSSYYTLPDAASYDTNDNLVYLFYMNMTTHTVDQWKGTGNTWTRTTDIITTSAVPYADSIASFIQSSPLTGGIFYISGSSSPYNLNAAILSFTTSGTNGTFTTTITPQNGFTGTVNLTTSISPPAGLTVNCNPTSITGGSGTSTCTVTSTSPGNYTVTVTGTSGTLNHSTQVSVTAPGTQDFTITASAPTRVNTGQSSNTTITVTAVSGFTGVVSLTDTVPSGLTCGSITPNSVTGSGTATVSCSATVAGNYTVTVTGTSGSLVHSTNATFRFQDFSITASAPSLSNVGVSASSTITVSAVNGFSGVVSLTDTIPTGLSCNPISPSGITGSGTASVSCTATTSGNYTLTITGTSTTIVHTTTATFRFANYTITATSPAIVNAGQSATSTITVTSQNHFAGTVTLTRTVPTGLTCGTITPATIVGQGTATLACSSNTAGSYTVTVTGTSGTLIHNTTAIFKFQNFTITASSPAAVTVGKSANSTITLAPGSTGFTGTVTLTDTVPSSLTCGPITPTSSSVPGTATLSCSSTTAANYVVTITATSGSLVHNATATFTITNFNVTATTPTPVTVGTQATSTITISALNGFTGTVNLTDTIPSGLTCGSISPGSVTNSGTATVACSATVAANYTLTITGTSGTLSHSTTIVFKITDYALTATNPATVLVGTMSTSTINVSPVNGFTGTISLNDTIPTGLTCNPINPGSLTNSGTATVSCNAAVAGNYVLTITGKVGSLTHSTTVTFHITNFSITATSPTPVLAGTTAASTITVTGINGFTGIVTLTDTVPSNLTCTAINPANVTNSGAASLSCSSTIAANYTVTITGTSGTLSHSTTAVFNVTDFTISATVPTAVTVGTLATSTITVAGINGFTGTVSLTDTVPPSLTCAMISPANLTNSGSATVSCSSTQPGNYTLTITGATGSLSHSTIASFHVTDFHVTATVPAPANAGVSATSTIAVSALNGFTGTISLTDAVPSGLNCGAITPPSLTNSGTATVSCSSNTAGNYTLNITATSGTLSHSATITFTARDFSIGATSPAPVAAGTPATSTITITALNGFTGTVNLTDTVPSNLTCGAISPASLTGYGTATISCSSTVPATYTLTINGTSGSLSHTATAIFTIGGFSLTATSPSAVLAGASAISTITVGALNGFTGNISLTDVVPANLSCGVITPSSLTNSGNATVSCSSTIAGNYVLNITATSGTLSHSTTATFTIRDFTITATPPSPVILGASATSTITITALNGFTGTISFTDTLPVGLLCGAITPANIINSGTATVSCSSATAGNYTLTITGASGSLNHSTNASFHFTDFTVNSSSPAPVNAVQSATSTITVTALNGFAGTVTLTNTAVAGLSCGAITPGSIAGSGSATVSCSSTTAGTFTLTINGTSGAVVHTATATFKFVDFTIAASSPARVNIGQSTTSTITITAVNGFAGVITLADTPAAGLTCNTITPGTVSGSGTATVSCSSTTVGTYSLNITGTSTTLVHSAIAQFTFQDFTVTTFSPAAVTIGKSANSTINLAAGSTGFTATVNLTDTVPSGLACGSITPSSSSVPGTSTLSCSSTTASSFLVIVTATSGSLVHNATATFSFTNFAITASTPIPSTVGTSSPSTITITPLGGFTGNVSLTDTLPAGLTCGAITPANITNSGTATVSCSATFAANYNLTITGMSGTLSHSTTVTFRITDFTITANTPAAVIVGSSTTSTLTITALNGFTGTVALNDSLPIGLTCTPITPTSLTSSGTATLSCNASSAANYPVTITAKNGTLSHSTTITFQVTDFTITASLPAPVTIGTSAASTITIAPVNGYTGTVTLTDTVPANLGCGPITPSIITNSGSATVSCVSTRAANYTLTLTGTYGSLIHQHTVLFQVEDFAVTGPTQIVIPVGTNSSSTLTLTSLNRYSGNITLTSAYLESQPVLGGSGGVGRAFNMAPPASTPTVSYSPSWLVISDGGSGQSTVTVTLSLTLQPGSYWVNIIATDGGLQHTLSLKIIATDFSLDSTTSNLTVPQGNNSTQALSLQSLNGFQAILTLTASVSPNGPSATLNPSTVQLTPNGNTTLLTIIVPSSTAPGNYVVTVIATAGTLAHLITVNVYVPSGLTAILTHTINPGNAALIGVIGSISVLAILPVRRSFSNKHGGNPRAKTVGPRSRSALPVLLAIQAQPLEQRNNDWRLLD